MKRICVIALFLSLLANANCPGQAASTAPARDRVLEWKQDIEFFSAELQKRHPEPFHRVTKEAFEQEIGKLQARVQALEDADIVLELIRITAMLGDSHTTVTPGPKSAFSTLPIMIREFSDGFFIVAADAKNLELIGRRVLGIGKLDMQEAARRLSAFVASENKGWVRYRVLDLARTVEFLHAIDSSTRERMTIRVEDASGESTVELEAPARGQRVQLAFSRSNPPVVPQYAQRRKGLRNWSQMMGDQTLLYVRYNVCADEPNQTVAKFCDDVVLAMNEHNPRKVLIDLRGNSGGNSSLLRPLINDLARREITRRGELFVATDRMTFSSGLWNAIELKTIGAKLIGEPPGSRPNHFGEVKSFQLPTSGVLVQYSTRKWKLDRTGTDPDELAVDIPVAETSANWFAGVDAITEHLLKP